MKTRHIILIASAMFSLLLLQNCGPKGDGCEEHEPVNTYYNISNDDKSKIPFTGTDTLVYISNMGDTAVLYGQGKKAFTEKVAEKWNHDPGCSTYDYNYFENIEFTYQGSHPDLNYMLIDFNANEYGPDRAKANVTINETNYITNFKALNNLSLYKDSVLINQTKYIGIRIFDQASLFYLYNYYIGLIQVRTTNKTWIRKL